MRTGARPGEQVLAECKTILPWFGPMLEANFAVFFETNIAPVVPVFAEVDARGGLAVDLGCGSGWYLRALARRFPKLRGLGLDGFGENIAQAVRLAAAEGLAGARYPWPGAYRKGRSHRDEPCPAPCLGSWTARLPRFAQPQSETGRRDGDLGAELADRARRLAQSGRPASCFQNLTEHAQGNHLLRADEIAQELRAAGLDPQVHLFAEGHEAVVARKPA